MEEFIRQVQTVCEEDGEGGVDIFGADLCFVEWERKWKVGQSTVDCFWIYLRMVCAKLVGDVADSYKG